MPSHLQLTAAIGDMIEMRPIHDGSAAVDSITLHKVPVSPFHVAFRHMVRELRYDLSEMPIATLGQARLADVPLFGLPLPASSRMHHGSILTRIDSDIRGPEDLKGKRVLARSWPQTTGIWVRGILQHEYDIDLTDISWIVQEGPHVESFQDPDYVTCEESDEGLLALLNAGKVDAITGLHGMPAGTRHVIPDAIAAGAAWSAREGVFPINHVMCLKRELALAHPWLPAAVTALYNDALRIGAQTGALDSTRFGLPPDLTLYQSGLQENRKSMQMLLDFSKEQGILPLTVTLDWLFE